MRKISSTIIEEMAVHSINTLILNGNTKLKSDIPVGDRGVSFDGGINVYKNSDFKKENFLGFIPVQVKGKTVTKFSPIQARFSVNVDDLKNYNNAGGVIYFLSEIKDSQTTVYAKILLPLDIDPLLKKSKGQSTVTVSLNPLKSYLDLERICMHFLREKKRQPTGYIGKYSFQNQNYEGIKVTSLSLNPKGKTSDLFEQDMYAYGISGELEHPISIVKLNVLNRNGISNIIIGGEEVPYQYSLSETKDTLLIVLEDTLTISANSKNNVVNFKVDASHSINSYKKVLLFLKESYQKKHISLFNSSVKFDGLSWEKSDFIDFDAELEIIPYLEKVFSEAGISFNYFTKSTSLLNMAVQLEKFLINHNYDSFNISKTEMTGILKLYFEEDFVLVFYSHREGIYKSLNTEDFNDVGISLTSDKTEKYYKVSPFLLVSIDDLFEAANSTVEVLKKSFSPEFHTYNDITFTETNRFVIDSINKYDQSKNNIYLELAYYIGQNSQNGKHTKINAAIMTVNLLQTQFRRNSFLDENEQLQLIKIKEEKTFSEEFLLKFCCNVLLKNKSESKYYFTLLSPEEKNELRNYPINFLYENLVSK